LQAGFGIEQLKRVPQFEIERQRNFDGFAQRMFEANLSDWYSLPTVDPKAVPSWFALPLILNSSLSYSRDELTFFLDAHGVETRPIVAGNLARHPVRERFPHVFQGVFEGADVVHNRGFYVGLYPEPMDPLLDRLVGLLGEFHLRHS
jgi:CDP-6-deoxy-D-xylo-4-hexulose-3-dehydrase